MRAVAAFAITLQRFPTVPVEQVFLSRVVSFEYFHDTGLIRFGRYGSPEQFCRFVRGAKGDRAAFVLFAFHRSSITDREAGECYLFHNQANYFIRRELRF